MIAGPPSHQRHSLASEPLFPACDLGFPIRNSLTFREAVQCRRQVAGALRRAGSPFMPEVAKASAPVAMHRAIMRKFTEMCIFSFVCGHSSKKPPPTIGCLKNKLSVLAGDWHGAGQTATQHSEGPRTPPISSTPRLDRNLPWLLF